MKATLVVDTRTVEPDGAIVQVRIWFLPAPVPPVPGDVAEVGSGAGVHVEADSLASGLAEDAGFEAAAATSPADGARAAVSGATNSGRPATAALTAAWVNVTGGAFGVADNTVVTVMDVLLAADAQAVNGVLYGGNTTRRDKANAVFGLINQAGGIN